VSGREEALSLHRLEVAELTGILPKPVANRQLEALDDAVGERFHRLGRALPRHCAEVLAVARHPASERTSA
jgi:hypothetical protein